MTKFLALGLTILKLYNLRNWPKLCHTNCIAIFNPGNNLKDLFAYMSVTIVFFHRGKNGNNKLTSPSKLIRCSLFLWERYILCHTFYVVLGGIENRMASCNLMIWHWYHLNGVNNEKWKFYVCVSCEVLINKCAFWMSYMWLSVSVTHSPPMVITVWQRRRAQLKCLAGIKEIWA